MISFEITNNLYHALQIYKTILKYKKLMFYFIANIALIKNENIYQILKELLFLLKFRSLQKKFM